MKSDPRSRSVGEHHQLIQEELEENLLAKAAKERLKPDPSGSLPLYQAI